MTLTVTTADGRTASTSQPVNFVQRSSKDPSTGCPSGRLGFTAVVFEPSFAASSTLGSVFVKCPPGLPCVGGAALTFRPSVIRSAQRKRRPIALGSTPFFIPAGTEQRVPVRFNKKARRLLRKRRRIRATLTLTSIAPSGKAVNRSKAVVLKTKAKPKKKKPKKKKPKQKRK